MVWYLPVLVMPTTSMKGPVAPLVLNRLPMGFSFGQKRAPMVWLTMATRGAPSPSDSTNARPRKMLMRMVSKYDRSTLLHRTLGGCRSGASGWPSIETNELFGKLDMATFEARLTD